MGDRFVNGCYYIASALLVAGAVKLAVNGDYGLAALGCASAVFTVATRLGWFDDIYRRARRTFLE